MKINVHQINEDNERVSFEGELTKKEVSFLLQYAVNALMAAGVIFDLQAPPDEENIRFKTPEGATLQ